MQRVIKWLVVLAVGLAPAAAAADTFVLVHGAFQTARTWDVVAQHLRDDGHDVVTVDLPGRNATGAAAQAVRLDDYVETVRRAVDASDGPVVLVGHSFGGMTISAVAEQAPERIARLIYVAAYVPQSGESMETLALRDTDNRFTTDTFVVAPDYSFAEILDTDKVRVFAQDADPDESADLTASMVREPLGPIRTPVTLSQPRFGAVEKAYVRTRDDGTVSFMLQTMMIERAGISAVQTIDSGHAPQLTRPGELATALAMLAR